MGNNFHFSAHTNLKFTISNLNSWNLKGKKSEYIPLNKIDLLILNRKFSKKYRR